MSLLSSKGKVKKSTKKALADKDVIEGFQDMLGTGKPSPKSLLIMVPKYDKIKEQINRFMKTIKVLLGNSCVLKSKAEYLCLNNFIEFLNQQISAVYIAPDMAKYYLPKGPTGVEAYMFDYTTTPDDVLEEFGKCYQKGKQNPVVTIILQTCKNLKGYQSCIGDLNALSDNFIITAPMELCLFYKCRFDFKRVHNEIFNIPDEGVRSVERDFLLRILNKLFTIGLALHELIISPDIDLDEFVSVLIDSIDSIKTQIPRCEEAFNEIRKSIGLLKNNFGDYYGKFASTGNPTVIMENFVKDVADKSEKVNPTISVQFQQIIAFYSKKASSTVTDPRIKNLLKHVNANLKLLENVGKKMDSGAAEAEDEESDDESAAESDEEVKEAISEFEKMSKSKIIDDKVFE